MTKLILCVVLCSSTLMCSMELHRKKTESAEAAGELADIVGKIISLLRFESADVYSICREAFTKKHTAFLSINSGDFPALWDNACNTLCADEEAVVLFRKAGRILGSADTESQIESLLHIQSELREHAKTLRQKTDETKKLYYTLGALSGIAAAIIVI